MKIQFCSDLHLEFPENREFLNKNPLAPEGEILLLGGDITCFAVTAQSKDFFDWAEENFSWVYWIPGNHEYYHYDISRVKIPLNEQIRRNVLLLNNQTIQLKNVEIIFSTLWSVISTQHEWIMRQNVSDFSMIRCDGALFTPFHYNRLHDADYAFLKSALSAKTRKKRIVVTHHVPTLLNYPGKYKHSHINEAFAVELYDLIASAKVDYWIYGHHHVNVPAFTIGQTTMLTNQLGYVKNKEYAGFNQSAVIEIT